MSEFRSAGFSGAAQRGVSSAFLIIAIVVIGVATLLITSISRTEVSSRGDRVTRERQLRIAEALTAFAVANRRLPCPAVGTDDAGTAAPATAAPDCTDDGGVVPWAALGLRRDDAIDGWGRKISYRVFDGTTGLTQTDGASATDCNTSITASLGPLVAGGKCNPVDHVNPVTDFTTKGFTVRESGSTVTGIAFALISHGETGYGGYAAEGTGRVTLPTAGGDEAANAAGTAPYYMRAHSDAGVAPANNQFFDDLVVYRTVDDLVRAAQMAGRPWGTNPGTVASGTFTQANIAAALAAQGSPAAPNAYNTGVTSLAFTGFTITAGISGRNISSGNLPSGQGIGTIATSGSTSSAATLSSTAGEFLRVAFSSQARYLGVTIVEMQRPTSGNAERVRFTFSLAGTTVATITKSACAIGGQRANFGLDPGGNFDRVDVLPISTTSGAATTILLGSLRSCTASVSLASCTSPTAVASEDCP